MTIESNLKRIADSLEKIADYMANEPPAPAAPIEQPVAPTPPVAPVAETTAPPAAPAAPVAEAMTPEQLNTLLVSEFKRIGDRAPIDAAMKQLGVTSVANLPADKQQQLIATVQAIPGAAA